MASSVSGGIFNELFYLYMAIALIVGALVIGWLSYILVKYRARPDQPKPRDAPRAGVLPAERGHPIWSYVMAGVIAAIMFGLAFGTISAATELETPPEEGPRLDVTITGLQFGWRLTYEGEGGIPISNLTLWTVPVDTAIVADVVSQDVWHNFALTEYRIRIDVVPGQTNHIWWKAHETGIIEPVCVQLCGTGHALMKTRMRVVEVDEFRAYVESESARLYERMAAQGQSVNVTYDGATFQVGNATVDTTKAYGVRIDNQGATEERFTFGEHVLTLAAGETGHLYAPPQATKLEALSTDAFVHLGGEA